MNRPGSDNSAPKDWEAAIEKAVAIAFSYSQGPEITELDKEKHRLAKNIAGEIYLLKFRK